MATAFLWTPTRGARVLWRNRSRSVGLSSPPRRQLDYIVPRVALAHGERRDADPVFHRVPFLVVPGE